MALTLDQLRKLLDGEGLRYFIAPDRPALMLGVTGLYGRYQFVATLDCDGQFVQFRTISYCYCPPDHPHLNEMLKVLGALNYRTRLVKWGWDPGDGEVVCYADLWAMDGTMTQQQCSRMLQNYMPAIDVAYGRIRRTLDTGTDPGEEDPQQIAARLLGGGGLPAAVRSLLEKLKGKGKAAAEPDLSSI